MMNLAGIKIMKDLYYYTAFVETGRVYDSDKVQFKKAFYEIAKIRQSTVQVYM